MGAKRFNEFDFDLKQFFTFPTEETERMDTHNFNTFYLNSTIFSELIPGTVSYNYGEKN